MNLARCSRQPYDKPSHFRFYKILGINGFASETFSSHYAMDFRPQSIAFLFLIFILLLLKVNLAKSFRLQNVFDVPGLLATPEAKFKITKDEAKCKEQVMLLVGGYQRKELWALKVLDAWGKSQSGLFSGNLINFGHYEQCLEVKYKFNDTTVGDFFGQHCMVFFKDSPGASVEQFNASYFEDLILPEVSHVELMRQHMDVVKARMGTALCVPSICTGKMVRQIADRIFAKHNLRTTDDYNQELVCNTVNIMEMRSIDMLAA